jgi:hypothetical protein
LADAELKEGRFIPVCLDYRADGNHGRRGPGAETRRREPGR